MRFSHNSAVAVAMAASLATATPHGGLLDIGADLSGSYGGLDLGKPLHAGIDLSADLSGKILVAGFLADVAVGPVVGAAAGAEVVVNCEECLIKGDIDASISLEKVVPALSLSLKDIEVLLGLDVYIGAAATIAVNLVTPAKISLPLPGLQVEALVSLDLVLGVHTELDISAGVYVSLPEASLETNIVSGDILDVDFSGVVVKVLPVEVRIGCTELLADLRLRVDLGLAAAVDVDDILPLDQIIPGLDIPAVGAGLELAVYANLLEYVGLFCAAPECPLVKESYGLNVGAAVELGVAVEDLLSIHLAPTVATALLSIPTSTICIPSYTNTIPPYTTPGSPGHSSGVPTSSGSVPTGVPTSSGPGGEPTSSGPGSSPTSSAPGSPSGSPTSSGPGSSSGPASTGASSTGAVSTPSGPATTPAPGGDGGSVTSTITNTATYTVTACAVNIPNCPAGYQTSVTVIHTTSFTTVCPATATGSITAAPAPSHTGSHNIETITKHVTTMVPCDSTSTFVPPTSISSIPYPSDVPTHVPGYSSGSSSPSSPAGETPGSSPTGYPTPSYSSAGSSPSYPAGGPGASYPAGSSTGSSPVSTPAASSPAGGPSVTYPAGGSGPVGYPTPTGIPYPTGPVPPNGGNGASSQPSASATFPASYPTTTPPVTAGAGKVGSSIAAVVALMGAVMAL